MSRVVFSRAAVADREEITAYTVERFGLEQACRLREHFQATFERLVAAPHIGRTYRELDPRGRSFRYLVVMRRFVVVYEAEEGEVRVARILHGARLLPAELGREPEEGP